jgi:hypothetical protein
VGGAGSYLVALSVDSDEAEGLRAGDLLVVEPVTVDQLEPDDLAVLRTTRGAAVEKWHAGKECDGALSGRVLSVIRRVRQPEIAAAATT